MLHISNMSPHQILQLPGRKGMQDSSMDLGFKGALWCRLLDDNRELYVPELGEMVKPHPHFMLFATQNPAGAYGGRKVPSPHIVTASAVPVKAGP